MPGDPFGGDVRVCGCHLCRAAVRQQEIDAENRAERAEQPVVPTLQCEFCQRSTNTSFGYEIEERADRGDRIMCQYCYRAFSQCDNGDHLGPYVTDYHVRDTAADIRMCENCFNDAGYHVCDYCEHVFSADVRFPDDYICQVCYDERDECDEGDYDGDYCDEDDGDYRYVMNYTHRPELRFNRMEDDTDNFYMGLELETDSINVFRVSESVHNYQSELFCKTDASLYGGVEIVSHPGTLAAWKDGKVIDWDQWGETTAHCPNQAGQSRAGIHVHVSRTAFERNGKWAASHLWKFMQLHYRNELAFKELAGRDNSVYAEWNPISDRSKTKDDVKNDGAYGERMRVININNRDTVEMRYFQADERKDVILQCIELVHASVEYTRTMTAKEVKADALDFSKFRTWVSGKPEVYPELRTKMNRMVADGIITTNRALTREQDKTVKARNKAEKVKEERRRQWFRQLNMTPLRPGARYLFNDYPRLSDLESVRSLFTANNDFIRYLASSTTSPTSFISLLLDNMTVRYARVMLRATGRDTYYMVRSDWFPILGYAAAQLTMEANEAYSFNLSNRQMEALITAAATDL